MAIEQKPLYGGIEAGGTKFVCAVGSGPDNIRDEVRFPTTTPDETLAQAIDYFQQAEQRHGPLQAIGIGTFGPAGVKPGSASYGKILTTPKAGWTGADIVGTIQAGLGELPIAFDTDVNAAALAEARWGAARGVEHVLYLTVGTGIGGGMVTGGRALHGMLHPEMGHIHVPPDSDSDTFAGSCPFHGRCFEGMASGTAMHARWGVPPTTLPPDHEAWQVQARCLGAGLTTLICTLSPERIVLGGGVMEQDHLFPLVRRAVRDRLNGYLDTPELADLDSYIVPPALGNRAGIAGALLLAEQVITAQS